MIKRGQYICLFYLNQLIGNDKKPERKEKDFKKEEDHMKVTTEDLYSWIDDAYQKLETSEGRTSIRNAWKGCGYVISS